GEHEEWRAVGGEEWSCGKSRICPIVGSCICNVWLSICGLLGGNAAMGSSLRMTSRVSTMTRSASLSSWTSPIQAACIPWKKWRATHGRPTCRLTPKAASSSLREQTPWQRCSRGQGHGTYDKIVQY